MPSQAPGARIGNYNEIKTGYTAELAVAEALRCMNCPGRYCARNCPIHNPVPQINERIREKDFDGAWELLASNSPLPEVCSRVCDQSRQCESECSRGIKHEAVSIGGLERFLADGYAGKNAGIEVAPPTGKKVAIVGAGPAGISAAWDLMRKGHSVTVFEKQEEPGGLMMYGIPNMKLDKGLLLKRFELMRTLGVKFICGAEVSKDIPAADPLKDFDAVLLAIGTAEARKLNVSGSGATGVVQAVEYLKAGTRNALEKGYELDPALDAAGKNVIIIGAGDTGTDCAATAIRQGAASIHQFEIAPKPEALPGAEKLPWKDWPRVFKTEYGQEEVIAKYGEDPRIYGIRTEEILSDGSGKVKEIKTVLADGGKKTWKADLVITAMGFTGPDTRILTDLGVKTDGRGNVVAGEEDYGTGVDKVFACGDARRGQSLVIRGVAEGKEAAASIDRYLNP